MTLTDIVYRRRLATVIHAIEGGNISATHRVFGVSRKTNHGWVNLFEAYGPDGLRPKEKRCPQMPNATPITSSSSWRIATGDSAVILIDSIVAGEDGSMLSGVVRATDNATITLVNTSVDGEPVTDGNGQIIIQQSSR